MKRVYLIILATALVIITSDQITKAMFIDRLPHEGFSIPVFSWWHWTRVHNYGAAFGIFSNLPESIRLGFFLILPIAVLALLYWTYVRKIQPQEILNPFVIGLVVGGAVGNLIDRIRFGYVFDFIDWFFPTSGGCIPLFYKGRDGFCHWPVFNVADAAITTAICLLFLLSFRKPSGENAPSSRRKNRE